MSSRSKKSIKNLSAALIGQALGIAISFVARYFFVSVLGSEYLGLNGLFTNILSVLSLAELGVGEAIIFSLYKPLAENNDKKCAALMQLYKKIYIIIGIAILLLGAIMTPFISLFVDNAHTYPGIHAIFLLFVINSSISYFYSYRRNLIIADQKRYIATIYRYSFYFLVNVLQILVLIMTKNYYLFLIIQIVFTLLENIAVSNAAKKMYPSILCADKTAIDDSTKETIRKNTKAMMMHRVGGVIVSSTDNIILSKFVGLVSVGLYSNYYLIISALNTVIGQMFNSLTASVGNLFAIEKEEKTYLVFNRVLFANFCIYTTASVCLLTCINDLIAIWLGDDYLLPLNVTIILVINFYISGLRKTSILFKDAAGLFYKDRWKSVVEGIINIITSIILVIILGMPGVFLGTLISSILTCVWVEPYVLFKYGFKKPFIRYVYNYMKYIITAIIVCAVSVVINGNIAGLGIWPLVMKLFISITASLTVIVIVFGRKEEFLYYTRLAKKAVRKVYRRND